ncbi:NAD-dependent epimerase/dehydratase family protein [Streptomyces lavendulae]|uniref:NAD-dependent epimerase/dehydratase family protein n=1 Tax=Streptomyces lavendulae TaxID=1914 RepID=UPI0037F54D53
MKEILVIGGSRYFGRHLVTLLRDEGHAVTVLNRGSAAPPPGVAHLAADRDDGGALRAALGTRTFDVVLDQVCYTAEQAETARRVFSGGRAGRYVMTSTMEVYDPATLPPGFPVPPAGTDPGPVAEGRIDPTRPGPPSVPRRPEGAAARYAEGKRRAEAVFLCDPALPYVSVRSAHVLGGGAQDFTGRLAHYVERIAAGLPVDVHEDPYATSFIHHREIARFLAWAALGSFTGPVNAASHGPLTVHGLADRVAARLGRPARYRVVEGGREASPFSFDRAYALDNGRATRLGFSFAHTGDWLPGAIEEAVEEAVGEAAGAAVGEPAAPSVPAP